METPDDIENIYIPTGIQQGVLYHSSLVPNKAVYLIQLRLNLDGEIHLEFLQKTLQYLVDRHESLRSLVLYDGLDEPAIVVKRAAKLPVKTIDLTAAGDSVAQSAQIELNAKQLLETPLPLDEAPLMRATIFLLAADKLHLILDFHHIVFDGWSNVALSHEFKTAYNAFANNKTPDLAPATKFSEYVLQQMPLPVAAKNYWHQVLKDISLPTSLPQLRNAGESVYTDGSYHSEISQAESLLIRSYASNQRVTLNTLVIAAWALTLARYNDTQEVVLGITVNGRSEHIDAHSATMGLFANSIPLRISCPEHQPLNLWLKEIQDAHSVATTYESTPLSDIRNFADVPPGVSIFDALLVFQSFPEGQSEATSNLTISPVSVHENTPLPLIVEVFDLDVIKTLAMYSRKSLPSATAMQLVDHLGDTLKCFSKEADASIPLKNIQLPYEVEYRQKADASSSAPPVATKPSLTLVDLFRAQHKRTPNAVALVENNKNTSFDELQSLSDQVTNCLENKTIVAGSRIGILMHRSVSLYAAILGTMNSRSLYVPLDPAWPEDRLRWVLKDAGIAYTLTDDDNAQILKSLEMPFAILDIDSDTFISDYVSTDISAITARTNHIDTSDSAYLMYTSGTTGKPKGVVGSHNAIENRFQWMWKNYPFADGEIACQKTPVVFVDSVWEMFGPLLKGVPVRIISDETRDNPAAFLTYIADNCVSRLLLVPSVLSVLIDELLNDEYSLPHLRYCIVSGENLPTNLIDKFARALPNCTLLNLYGSTEVAGDVTANNVSASTDTASASIGKPIDGCIIHILGENLRPMPIGAVGELCVAGSALAHGYYNNPSETAAAFINNPFGPGKLFRTGDLGFVDQQGNVFLNGRKDSLQKIAGQRVSPTEIKSAIESFEGVDIAVVAVQNNRILAWYSCNINKGTKLAGLENYLRSQLPPHTIPSDLTAVTEFPRLSTGKIDVLALTKCKKERATTDQTQEPQSDTEIKLAQLWAEVLDGNSPDNNRTFIESGGSSIDAMRLNAKIHREFGQSIAPRLFLIATFKQLAASLDNAKEIYADNKHNNESAQITAPTSQTEAPIMFQSGKHYLYGYYQQPVNCESHTAVLFCSSIGHEYMKAHRVLRSVSNETARMGHATLRFDYSGFGNSSGDTESAQLQTWLVDIKAAAQELHSRSGAKSICLVGVRIGAALMQMADVAFVTRVIAWDPISSGKEFTAHLDKLHQYAMNDLDRYRRKQRYAHPWERFGYTYSANLWADINKVNIDWNSVSEREDVEVKILVSRNESTDDAQLDTKEIRAGSKVSTWENLATAQSIIIAQDIEQQLVHLITDQ